jgi:acetyltransferase-like isoleucine patch superfamily enzyme
MTTDQLQINTAIGEAAKPALRRRIATSQARLPRFIRWAFRSINSFAVPAPNVAAKPLLWLFLSLRSAFHFVLRVAFCEPLFKAYCKKYGRNLHTGCYLPWINGKGDIVLGDNVLLDGAITIAFAARFSSHPTLEIGDNTGVGNGCRFTVGKLISIGRNCNFSGDITIMDSNGHDTDPASRWAHLPPVAEDVRPVIVRDGVWVGRHCIIFPGVRIGEGSVISAGSVVRTHVPPYSVVAGNPAKVMFRLKKPDVAAIA